MNDLWKETVGPDSEVFAPEGYMILKYIIDTEIYQFVIYDKPIFFLPSFIQLG